MTLEQACEQAILEYAPYYKQLAALQGQHTKYVNVVIKLHRDHYNNLVESGATTWTDIPAEHITWLNENMPYTV